MSSPNASVPESAVVPDEPPAQPAASEEAASISRSPRANWAVPALIAGMLLCAALLYVLLLRVAAPGGAPGKLTWWALAIGFTITESLIIHLPVQRDSHTVSMSEIPLVLGLALAEPAAVIVGRLVAGIVVLVARRQPLFKLIFNMALFTLETTVALAVYRTILGDGAPASPLGWIAAMAAVGIAVTVSAALVDGVIALSDRHRRFSVILKSFAAGSLISIAVGFLGTIAVVVVEYEPRASTLLAAALIFFFALFRFFSRVSRRHDELSALYDFTNQMDGTLGGADIAAVTLREAVSILRAERGEIILSNPTDSHASYLGFTAGSDHTVRRMPTAEVAELFAIAAGPESERIYGPETKDSRLRICLGQESLCGVIAPIQYGTGSDGVLVLAGRTGITRRFSPADLELLDTIANHASLTLERASVIERLKSEVAEKLDVIRSKDQLIAAVSHELRTPLTGVLGFAEMLRDNRTEFSREDEDAMLRSIAEEAGDLTNLVEDLLTAARAQMGSLTIAANPVPLRPLISRVIETTLGSAHHVVVSGPETVVWADDGRVRQILRNLITNAQRYGGHQIHVATHVAGKTVHIRVSDNGDGIPESDQERIFAAYESAHDPGTQPGSLGLGLSISRSLARLMGGDLSYQRTDGWTTFDFQLPAFIETEEPVQPASIEFQRV
ncbi:MAG: ATP-binding protein [Acidimicrobiia bacterium]|nr:ATP-binding protein [Acidimicrobiia bacterium]